MSEAMCDGGRPVQPNDRADLRGRVEAAERLGISLKRFDGDHRDGATNVEWKAAGDE